MLIEDVILFNYDLNYGWISLILKIFHCLFMISVFVILVDFEDVFSAS